MASQQVKNKGKKSVTSRGRRANGGAPKPNAGGNTTSTTTTQGTQSAPQQPATQPQSQGGAGGQTTTTTTQPKPQGGQGGAPQPQSQGNGASQTTTTQQTTTQGSQGQAPQQPAQQPQQGQQQTQQQAKKGTGQNAQNANARRRARATSRINNTRPARTTAPTPRATTPTPTTTPRPNVPVRPSWLGKALRFGNYAGMALEEARELRNAYNEEKEMKNNGATNGELFLHRMANTGFGPFNAATRRLYRNIKSYNDNGTFEDLETAKDWYNKVEDWWGTKPDGTKPASDTMNKYWERRIAEEEAKRIANAGTGASNPEATATPPDGGAQPSAGSTPEAGGGTTPTAGAGNPQAGQPAEKPKPQFNWHRSNHANISKLLNGDVNSIKKLQKELGVKEDGIFGMQSALALQKVMKERGLYDGPLDGKIGRLTKAGLAKMMNGASNTGEILHRFVSQNGNGAAPAATAKTAPETEQVTQDELARQIASPEKLHGFNPEFPVRNVMDPEYMQLQRRKFARGGYVSYKKTKDYEYYI